MNFCPKCGARVRPGAKFCSGCGGSVDGGVSAPVQADEPTAASRYAVVEPTPPDRDRPATDETVIPKSKRKIIGFFFGCLAFVAIAFLMMAVDPDDWRTSAAPFGILFFGAGAVASACMMFGTKPGMVLNSRGFEFMAAAKSTGFVRWSDVAGYRVDRIMFQKMLVVLLKDPDAYCREHGGLGRVNMATCGSPVCIPKAAALAMDFNSMVSLFGRYFAKWGAARGRAV